MRVVCGWGVVVKACDGPAVEGGEVGRCVRKGRGEGWEVSIRERRQRRENEEGFGSGGIFLMDVVERWLTGLYLPKGRFCYAGVYQPCAKAPVRVENINAEYPLNMANC